MFNAVVRVQANFSVSYPVRVMRVKCIDTVEHLWSRNDLFYIQNNALMNHVDKEVQV